MEAKYKGDLEGFFRFIGPLTRNIVSTMARKSKKGTTCSHPNCLKRKPLEAAHLKGSERKIIIEDILSEYFQDDDGFYTVGLAEFEKRFVDAHSPIEKVIQPMCKKHHLEYDKYNGIENTVPIFIDGITDESGEVVYEENELEKLEENEQKSIKMHIDTSVSQKAKTVTEAIDRHNITNRDQVRYSKISTANGSWNFDIPFNKFAKAIYFVLYDQDKEDFKVSKVHFEDLPVVNLKTKDDSKYRFVINSDYFDVGSDFDFSKFFI